MSEVVHTPQLRFPEFSGAWNTHSIGKIGTFFSGGTPTSSNKDYYSGTIPFIGSGKISSESVKQHITQEALDSSSAKIVNEGDLLYALYGATSGAVALSKINGAINQAVLCIRTNENKFFLKTWLEKNKERILGTYLQGGQGNLSAQIVKSLKLNLPTKPEQQKIAAFLTAVDNKIEQLSKKQALLGEYKKGLMQQIFSQAIRFHSKGTSSQAQGEIDDTPGQPLLPNGNSPSGSDFPDWEEKKLGDITDLITKGTTPTSVGYNFTTEGINFIKVESIKNFKIDIGSVPKISEECHHHLKRSQLKNNDIVFSIAGTLGRTAIVKNKDLPANTNQALSIIRLNRSQHILFVHYLLNLESIDKYIHRMLSVGAQPNLSLQQVGDIQLQLPSLLEQSKITNFLSFIDSKIEQVGKQLDESKQFKKALLQQMFI